MGESRPSEEAIALFTNVFGYAPDPEALHAGECWQAERIDASLRRAKAEVWREAATRAREFSKPYSIDWWMRMTKREIVAAICRDVADAIDARAAQDAGNVCTNHFSDGSKIFPSRHCECNPHPTEERS